MLIRIKRFTLKYKMTMFTVFILMASTLTTGLVSFWLAQNALNRKGETILKNGVHAAILFIDKFAEDVDNGILSLEAAQESVKIHLLGPMNADGTRTINSPIDLGEHGYFIVYSPQGLEVMHPTLEGVNVWDYTDKNPHLKEPFYLVQDKIYKAHHGGGFTYYTWDIPFQDTLAKKIVYSLYYPKWDWVVTAGTYMQDFNQEARLILRVAIIFTLLVLSIVIFVSLGYISNLAKPIMQLESAMKDAMKGRYRSVPSSKRKDEVGRLVHGYNLMIQAIEAKDQRLYSYAYYDELTGLANRLRAEEDMQDRFTLESLPAYFVLMDIKNFKSINAVYGNHYGDEVIIKLAKVMQGFQRVGLNVYRLTGNEFALLFEKITEVEMINLLQNICNTMRYTLAEQGLVHTMQFYVGGVEVNGIEGTFESLYQMATVSLQHAKEYDQLEYVGYTQEMHRVVERFEAIEKHAKKDIQDDRFSVYYQPKVDSTSNRVVGVEALARWFSEELGAVGPNEFIPVLNRTHLMTAFTTYMIRKTIKDLPRLKAKYGEGITLSINLCPVLFLQRDFVAILESILRSEQVQPSDIVLEITEDFFINHVDDVKLKIHDIRQMGVRVSLDDFGTGYSSLNYLRSFTLDEVKIDRSFIRDIHKDEKSFNMLKSIIEIAKILGFDVVAEGVEEEEQLLCVNKAGCSLIQGFYYGKPEPLDS